MTKLPLITDADKIEAALLKARGYIRSVEAFIEYPREYKTVQEMIADQLDGGEIKAIDDALLELGVVV